MVKPVESVFEHFTAPLTKAIGRAFTIPGMGQTQTTTAPTAPPTPPPQAAPPQEAPTGAANTQQMAQNQLSFLTAASKAAAAMGGMATGKSLLGQ